MVEKFTAKIGYSNQSSLNLFSKLGFKEVCIGQKNRCEGCLMIIII